MVITSTQHILPFNSLSDSDFERLGQWLLEAEGFKNVRHLGASGQDGGIDLTAMRDGQLFAVQCKRHRQFGPRKAEAAVRKLLAYPTSPAAESILFLVSCNVSRAAQERAAAITNGLPIEVWAETDLDHLVNLYPAIVEQFFGVNPKSSRVTRHVREGLADVGWGILYGTETSDAVHEALKPLLELRKKQAGILFREFIGVDAPQRGEDVYQFLGRHGSAPGPVSPKFPRYILIVGSPEEISFDFQQQLCIQHLVGRLYFNNPDEYSNYARSAVEAEESGPKDDRDLLLFSPNHDEATARVCSFLIDPLKDSLRDLRMSWAIHTLVGPEARKNQLELALKKKAPQIVIIGAHGVGYESGDTDQLENQGSIICADWTLSEPLYDDHLFTPSDAKKCGFLTGSVFVVFACYGAGTSEFDECTFEKRYRAAPSPFVSRIAQVLLGHPEGAALAFFGHVDRGWTTDIERNEVSQIEPFKLACQRLMSGANIGSAFEAFSKKYAELSAAFGRLSIRRQRLEEIDPDEFADAWLAMNSAKGFILMGDPGARML